VPAQVEEGLAVVTAMEESAAPSPYFVVAVVEEGRTVTKMTAPQVALEPPAGVGSGCEDMVMVPTDDGTTPRLPARERERSLEAMEPFPGLTGAKSSKEEESSPDTITPIHLQEGCYPLRVSPRTAAHNKAGSLYESRYCIWW
jgi:hypothetical protein